MKFKAHGAQKLECTRKYMRILSAAQRRNSCMKYVLLAVIGMTLIDWMRPIKLLAQQHPYKRMWQREFR